MTEKRKQFEKFFRRMFVIVLLTATALMVIDFYEVQTFSNNRGKPRFFFFAPIYSYVQDSISKLRVGLNTIGQNYDRQAEIESLRSQVKKLAFERFLVNQLNREIENLKEVYALTENISFDSELARVISHDPESYNTSIIINKGANYGLKEGMPVIAFQKIGFSLVGFLSEVSTRASVIQTLLDRRTHVSVVLNDLAATGIIKGKTLASSFLQLDFLRRDLPDLNGREVHTSGIGGKYPKGILLGKVAYTTKSNYEIFQTAYVSPTIDFFSLSEVIVITGDIDFDQNYSENELGF